MASFGFYWVAVPAVLLAGVSKGGFGATLGTLAVPLMSLAVPPAQAAAIMLPTLCAMDLIGFRVYFRKWDRTCLEVMIPGAVIGIGIGTAAFGRFDDRFLQALVGLLAIGFAIADHVMGSGRASTARVSRTSGYLWSVLSGFTSFIAHAGGPPALAYLQPQRLDKERFIGTINAYFLVLNMVKLLAYASLGQFRVAELGTSLTLAPLVPAGVLLGVWLQRRVTSERFYCFGRICLVVTGAQLMMQAGFSGSSE